MWGDKETVSNQKWKQREMVRSQEADGGPAHLCLLLHMGHRTGFTGQEREHQDLSSPLRELFSIRTRKSRVEHTKARQGALPQSQALAQEPQELHLTLF